MAGFEILKPDYERSILSISAALLKHYGAHASYPALPELESALSDRPKNVVFLILDCMGVNILRENLPSDSFLRKQMVAKITSVFPPTTTAATNALHSGLSPLESGWLGWMAYFKEHDAIVELFLNREFYTGRKLDISPIAESVLGYETIYAKIVSSDPSVEYTQVFPAFVKCGCSSFEEVCRRVLEQTQQSGPQLISAYWDEPDHTIHRHGISGGETQRVMNDLNNQVQAMVAAAPANTIFIITADHGAVDVDEIFLNEHKLSQYMKMPPSLEARYVTFFVKEECIGQFEKEFRASYENDFFLYKTEEFIKSGLLGPGQMHSRVMGFLGDYVAISKSAKSFRYALPGGPAKKIQS